MGLSGQKAKSDFEVENTDSGDRQEHGTREHLPRLTPASTLKEPVKALKANPVR